MKGAWRWIGGFCLALLLTTGILPALAQVPPGWEPKTRLVEPKGSPDNSANTSGESALAEGDVRAGTTQAGTVAAGSTKAGKFRSWLADRGMGLVKGIGAGLIGAAIVVGVAALVIGAGAPLLLMAGAALVSGAIYGLITGSARFNWTEAIVGSVIGGVSAGVGAVIARMGGSLVARATVAAVDMIAGGVAGVSSYLIHEPNPTWGGAAIAFGVGAGAAAAFMGVGAVVSRGWSWAKSAVGFGGAGGGTSKSAMMEALLRKEAAPSKSAPTTALIPYDEPFLAPFPTKSPESVPRTWVATQTPRGTAHIRGDIDWNLQRPIKRGGREIWVTNAEAAADGIAPVRRTADGKWEKVELHHSNQNFQGSFVELWESTHDKVPHKMVPNGESWRHDPHRSSQYRKQRQAHWSWRGKKYETGGEK